jgi:hypothetical protein
MHLTFFDMKKRSSFMIWAETMIIMIVLCLAIGLISTTIGLVALVSGLIPFLSPITYVLGLASGFFSGVAIMLPIIGLWQPIGAMLELWRIEGAISAARTENRTQRWYADGWWKWGMGVDCAGVGLDLYTMGGQ